LFWSLLFGIIGFVVLALFVGCFFLKRSRVHKNKDNLQVDEEERAHTSKISAGGGSSEDLAMPFHAVSPPPRKSTIREIAADEVNVQQELTRVGVVTIAVAEYNKSSVLVSHLKVSEDPAENCEAALAATRIMSQMRNPHLLGLLGYMWQDGQILNAVCEYVDLGTLGGYLRSARTELSWQVFKLEVALDIATCLMCFHMQHNLTYDALSDRTVFVDSHNGCKLSTMIASLPRELLRPEQDDHLRRFCAPEVLAGDSSTSASDMYSFGVLLVLLDLCKLPDDLTNVAFSVNCPSTIRSVAEACLHPDPSMRPSAQFASAQLQLLRKG
jgi:serine/threonine protein kinase